MTLQHIKPLKDLFVWSWNSQPEWLRALIIGAFAAHLTVLIVVSCLASALFLLKLWGIA
jgi:hypothetical protein